MGCCEIGEKLNYTECWSGNFGFKNVEPWRLCEPQWRGNRCWNIFYVIYKWVAFAYFMSIMVVGAVASAPFSWYTTEADKIAWFVYLTNWVFIVHTLSCLLNAISSTVCVVNKLPVDGSDKDNVPFHLQLNWFFYEMSGASALLVTVIYWGVLYDSDTYLIEIDSVTSHGINALYSVLIDMFITAMPIRALHFWVSPSLGIVYTIFTVIYDYTGGLNAMQKPYVYSVLDWTSSPTTAGLYSLGAVIGSIVFFFVMFGLYKLRMLIYSRCCISQTTSSETADPEN